MIAITGNIHLLCELRRKGYFTEDRYQFSLDPQTHIKLLEESEKIIAIIDSNFYNRGRNIRTKMEIKHFIYKVSVMLYQPRKRLLTIIVRLPKHIFANVPGWEKY